MSSYKAPGPTAIEVHSSKAIPNGEAEEIITQYIDATTESTDQLLSMSSDSMPSVVSRNHAMIQQLRRVQRDLRGLPPLEAEEKEVENKDKGDSNTTTDGGDNDNQEESEDSDDSEESEETNEDQDQDQEEA
ncbi:RNA polymerase I subunit RPA14-domain-containing protein [Yarrowia lipolytica]|jgi:hypothetical protein|uniref:YALI0D12815p n=2 Tax=Yarrowia lipolytica TaxID=4952 RepID=Q6C9A0_YARLI|nr:YALI0D12815p [Yarrowia lipolytica CLIB122]AOW03989.1 hypothetical protein YALI1_D15965g [Yarrowia lipolytica]KAB8285185.1 RNA polymerase I subunit RPA14-domain-containing protein [Yarrowia lipolytica]KAE8171231.1 RNA polymerase I subunit RPA14-domain-containing protein [Yarrowia lipolytica]KAJ8054449.1 RNA polymerase I subunit RPA14-domain-containing protein [Yarrowia lipolytica]QNP97818.1 Hypothetical protein YALI2_D00259g [Yarrowia lipolytica]|eukprot:XP_502762.1 YALI0D12815p [Yarrowia lipolytica CLIB122]